MAQIRETIELLANILKANGTSKIKAETFRQAKFNKNDAVGPMWKLLFELIYLCDYGKIDDVCIRAYGEMSTDERVVYVRTELQKRGFHSRDFGSLSLDMSSGSRELLLALGWLLCKDAIIDKFMSNCTSPLDDDTMALHQVGEDNKGQNKLLMGNLSENMEDKVQQLLLLNHKLQLSLRGLHSMQREKNRLVHKIHESTKGVSLSPHRDHLSMLEVYMLRHPELLKKNLHLLEKDNDRLQDLLKWRDHEDIYWKWMESVLDMKLQENHETGQQARPMSAPVKCSIPLNGVTQLQSSHDRLQDAIIKYETIVDRLEALWTIKSSEVSEAELDNVLAAIDLEISIQRANIALNNTDVYLHRAGYPNLSLVKKSPKTRPDESDTDTSRDIEDEIEILEDLVNRLQDDVIQQQNTYKEEMNNLSDKFSDAICIPPMARK